MKTNKLFLIGLVAVGLTACSSDEELIRNQKEDVNTYAGLSISLASPQTRAGVNQAQAYNVGRAAESAVARVSLYSTLNNHDWQNYNASKPASPTSNDFWQDGSYYTVGAFPAAAGTQRIGLVLNLQAGVVTPIDINTTTVGVSWSDDNHNAIKTIERLATENAFTMTSRRSYFTVLDGVDEATVNAQSTPDVSKNVFSFDLERLVSQAVVTKGAGLVATTSEVANSRVEVDLNSLQYAVINGATSVNFWLDEAGDRTITDVGGGTMKYNGLHSAIHSYLGGISDNWNDAKVHNNKNTAKLIRLGNYAPFTASLVMTDKATRATERATRNGELGGYAPIDVFATGQMADASNPVVSNRGIYFLENSVGSGAYTKANKDVGFYRLAYAKIYGQVKPVKIYGVKYEDNGAGGIKTTWDVVEYQIKSQTDYDAMPETTVDEKIAKAHTYVEYTTFYRGQTDDFLYANPLGAMIGYSLNNTWASDAEKATNAQPYYTYLDARCAWRALLNRQTGDSDPNDDITKAVQTANTRRNNIYWLEIGEIKKLGMAYDPSDPSDPNLPKANKDQNTDPDNDDTPDDPDIEVQHSYMKVMARVLQWNVVKRNAVIY